jgi:hypothetical protein
MASTQQQGEQERRPSKAARVVRHLNGNPRDNHPENLEIRDAE